MSNEFCIDKPGVYKNRQGKELFILPLVFGSFPWIGFEVDFECFEFYRNNGLWSYTQDGEEFSLSSFDIVSYVRPLPDVMIQRMKDAVAQAEGAK